MGICPKCRRLHPDEAEECPACGLIFRKYRKRLEDGPEGAPEETEPEETSLFRMLETLLFDKGSSPPLFTFMGRATTLGILLVWGGAFIFSSAADAENMDSVWHLVNLPFHEAGHIFFRPFGALITSMGGSLFQLMMPVICGIVLLIKTRDPFGASCCLWWLGENFMDLAPYINDARTLTLPLIGGNTGQSSPYGFHDWEFILTETGLLFRDHAIALATHGLGVCVMLLALAWGAFLLQAQFRNLRGRNPD